ncbi:MAG TPA: hypothetical protein VN026_11265 [Bacteroidia bacterium]|jgi:hypothetical protein|nr:hypothetical protein [Bacteroidia bacterium]
MKKAAVFVLICMASFSFSQREFEIILFDAAVNEFDVIGEDTYEKNNRVKEDITLKIKAEVKTTTKAEPSGGFNFEAINVLDGNMKTCWMSSGDGKNEDVEVIIDLEEVEGINVAVVTDIYFFSGWRKDYQTWKEYSRVKKMIMTVNDLPYGEITFQDTYKQQSIDLEKFKVDRTRRSRIRFRIVDTYKGSKYNQLALSDIQIIGKAK